MTVDNGDSDPAAGVWVARSGRSAVFRWDTHLLTDGRLRNFQPDDGVKVITPSIETTLGILSVDLFLG